MGLDVYAVKNAKRIEDPKVSEVDDLDCVFGGHFADRLGSLVDGEYYEGELSDAHFGCGYGRYGVFREMLAQLAGYAPKNTEEPKPGENDFMGRLYAFHHPHFVATLNSDGGPFYELINFSDCEGYIGPECCKKLADDFESFSDAADNHDNEWFKEKYFDMKRLFLDGSQSGYVRFC